MGSPSAGPPKPCRLRSPGRPTLARARTDRGTVRAASASVGHCHARFTSGNF